MTDETSVTIEASPEEVQALLADTLTPAEIAAVSVKSAPTVQDPLAPERHGELETARVVVEFIGLAVAGGITYDVIKKVTLAAIAKFGPGKVK